jgi:hypothetical protein
VFESETIDRRGVMKGYKPKEETMESYEGSLNPTDEGEILRQGGDFRKTPNEKFIKETGIFGGISGERNSLLIDDEQFDSKKHTVKDLAKHFSLVKPKTDIPLSYLPEQKQYNGERGPALNYLSSSQNELKSSTQSFTRRELTQDEVDASRKAYEMKKQQQVKETQSTSSQSIQSSSQVQMRTKTTSEQTTSVQQSQRRQSLKDALLLDPAKEHAQAGIIDPSAILRGGDGEGRSRSENWNTSSQPGEPDRVAEKWDNHNAIARGWGGMKENYHPVTFREIYNVDSQRNKCL